MTFKQLNCFLKVSETLNFARAAEALYTSQPSVTRSIKSLEEELGVTLFSRHSRKVELTQAGDYLQRELHRLSLDLDNTIQNTQKIQNQFSNEIRIGVTDIMELPYLPQTMQKFHEENPAISLQLHVKEFRDLVQAISEEKLDLIYCMRSAVSALRDKKVLLLRKGSLFCMVPPSSPLCALDHLTPEDLFGYPWIFRHDRNSNPVIAEVQQQLKELQPNNPVLYSESPAQAALMVKAGFGISIVVDYSVTFKDGLEMVPFHFSDGRIPQEDLDLVAVWRTDRKTTLVERFARMSCQFQQEEAQDSL